MLITQLKSHIYEIEQNERNFNKLQHKFITLQNEYYLIYFFRFGVLIEEKNRLEYDLRNRGEGVKQINELKQEMEDLNIMLQEK
jgi:hypothetical protein